MNAASFSAPKYEKLFRNFVGWLTNSVGPERAARTQNRYAEFFSAIQHAPVDWQCDVIYLAAIDGGFLRKSSKPRLYLESIGLQFDAIALKDAMDLRTINNNLFSIRENCGNEFRAQVDSFFNNRLKAYRDGETKMLTIRLESSAVTRLFEYFVKLKDLDISLRAISAASPGLRCTLGAFLRFLSTSHNVLLAFPEAEIEQRLVHLIRSFRGREVSSRHLILYGHLCMAVFHSLEMNPNNHLDISIAGDGFNVLLGGQNYWIPSFN